MKQTAVEWFAEITAQLGYVSTDILEQAKAMEKEQIKDAFAHGKYNTVTYNTSEQYYNETFKSE